MCGRRFARASVGQPGKARYVKSVSHFFTLVLLPRCGLWCPIHFSTYRIPLSTASWDRPACPSPSFGLYGLFCRDAVFEGKPQLLPEWCRPSAPNFGFPRKPATGELRQLFQGYEDLMAMVVGRGCHKIFDVSSLKQQSMILGSAWDASGIPAPSQRYPCILFPPVWVESGLLAIVDYSVQHTCPRYTACYCHRATFYVPNPPSPDCSKPPALVSTTIGILPSGRESGYRVVS